MGDIADMMIDGSLCEGCGVYMGGKSNGIPRRCKQCAKTWNDPHPCEKVACKTCGRKVKFVGMKDHMRDAHQS